MYFFRSIRSIYVIERYFFLHFFFKDFYKTSSGFSFSFSFTQWIRRQVLLENCFWRSSWTSFVEEKRSQISPNFFSKIWKQLYKISAQHMDSITSSKISVSPSLSDTFELLFCSLTFSILPSSFDLSLKSCFWLSRNCRF